MIFNDFYNIIKTKLSTIADIKNIEWYLEQDKRKGGIINTPTVLIQFKTSSPKQINKIQQEIEVSAEIKLFTDFKKTNQKITDNNIHFILEAAIFNALRKYEQIELIPAQRNNGLLYSSQTYKHKIVSNLPTNGNPNTMNGANLIPQINII